MRFEHLIEINSPRVSIGTVVPPLTREQLWRGLMVRVQTPQRFPMGPERCDWTEAEPGRFQRTLHFGQHVMHDEVVAEPGQRLVFTPQPHGDTAPIRLSIAIEEPQAGQMVLRFTYEALAARRRPKRPTTTITATTPGCTTTATWCAPCASGCQTRACDAGVGVLGVASPRGSRSVKQLP